MKIRTITFLLAFLAVYEITCEDGAEGDTTTTTPASNAEVTVGITTDTPNSSVTLSAEECAKAKEDYQVARKAYNEETTKYNVAMRSCRKTNMSSTTRMNANCNRTATRKSGVTTPRSTKQSSSRSTTVTPSSETTVTPSSETTVTPSSE